MIGFSLWSELPRNHPVSELWLETNTDLLATIYLAYGGFFRQALAILRVWFEISLHGVFFSAHYGQPSGRYEQWRREERDAPANIQKIAKALASRSDMLVVTDESTFIAKLEPIYSFLSNRTHAKGLDVLDLQDGRDNVPRYLPESYEVWYQKVLEAFNAIYFLHRIFFAKQIASYFSISAGEMERALSLKNSLGRLMPDFGQLMDEVFAYSKVRSRK